MARRDRTCYLCGEKYKYCGTCSQDRAKPSYLSEFHSESCKNIFDICTRFNMGMITKEEAQEAFMNCDLSNRDNFKSYVQRDLEVIFSDEPVIVELEEIKDNTHEVVLKENK